MSQRSRGRFKAKRERFTNQEQLGLAVGHARLLLGPHGAGDFVFAGSLEVCQQRAAEVASGAEEEHGEGHYGVLCWMCNRLLRRRVGGNHRATCMFSDNLKRYLLINNDGSEEH